jgi:hypothetical protein
MVNWVVRKPRLTPAKSRLISGPFLMKIAIAVALVFAVFVWDASLNDGDASGQRSLIVISNLLRTTLESVGSSSICHPYRW